MIVVRISSITVPTYAAAQSLRRIAILGKQWRSMPSVDWRYARVWRAIVALLPVARAPTM
jgi:hypothetical protein